MADATRLSRRAGAAAILAALLCAAPPAARAAGTDGEASRLVQEARDAAVRDEHVVAIARASRAMALDPTLEEDLALFLAHQLTWADRPADAVGWYRRALQREPGSREARLGLARALSWTGQLAEARAEYEALAAEESGDTESRLGLARTWAWDDRSEKAQAAYADVLAIDPASRDGRLGRADAWNRLGRHRAAETVYRELLAEEPADSSARLELARARYWMGESDAALAGLREADTAEARELREAIEAERSVQLDLFASRWVDVDDQELESLGLRAEAGASGGRRFVLEAVTFRADEPATPEIGGLRVTGGADWRADRRLVVRLRGGLLDVGRNLEDEQTIDVGAGEVLTAEEARGRYLLWEAWTTWTPADRLRVDLSHARIPLDTPRALARGIRADVLGLGADRALGDLLVARANVGWTRYTDDNARASAGAELEAGPFRPAGALRAWIAGGLSTSSFDESPDHGYYAPDRYDALHATTRLELPLSRRVSCDASLRVASERENDGDRFGVLAAGGNVRARLGRDFGVSAFVRTSTSRLESSAGYERDGWGFSLYRAP